MSWISLSLIVLCDVIVVCSGGKWYRSAVSNSKMLGTSTTKICRIDENEWQIGLQSTLIRSPIQQNPRLNSFVLVSAHRTFGYVGETLRAYISSWYYGSVQSNDFLACFWRSMIELIHQGTLRLYAADRLTTAECVQHEAFVYLNQKRQQKRVKRQQQSRPFVLLWHEGRRS